jgi:acetyl esterase/lipase
MPSLRARIINRFLRLTVKRMWRPGLQIEEARARSARIDARLGRNAPPVAMESVVAGGVPATWFGEPSLAARGTILYLHGGAWCMHLPGIFRRHATRLSAMTGMRVLLPEYRLAPEHPFPAGIDDCFAVYRWLLDQGYAERPLAIAGDSAGGSLSLVTLMRARDAMLPMPGCAALLSPSTDATISAPSAKYNAEADPMFSPAAMGLLADIYCPGQDLGNPLLSPLFGNWNGLPPLLFHVGSTEMILDDSVRAHDRARQAGVDAQIEVFVDMPHVFHVFEWMPESRVGMQAVADFITAHARHAGHDQPLVATTLATGSGPDESRDFVQRTAGVVQ